MCGRYYIDDETYALFRYQLELEAAGLIVSGEVFPTNTAPVITPRGVLAARWGFPKWSGSGVIINARAETASEKKMFANPLKTRRCAVPSCGFFEWDRKSGQRDKYMLRLPGEQHLYMAGITDIFRTADGTEFEAFVILTTASCGTLSQIHDRSPVILRPFERDLWLEDYSFAAHAIKRPCPELELCRVM